MRRGQSTSDFKDINRILLGGVPNLPIWQDNAPHPVASPADERVTYAVEARSTKVSFSWQLLVNDDMDAFSRIPAMLGDAAKRT